MKETLQNQSNPGFANHCVNNNGNTSTNTSSNNVANGNNTRKYAVLSNEWISTIGEELGIHPLPDALLGRLAEDASYRLREVLHVCFLLMFLQHLSSISSGAIGCFAFSEMYDQIKTQQKTTPNLLGRQCSHHESLRRGSYSWGPG